MNMNDVMVHMDMAMDMVHMEKGTHLKAVIHMEDMDVERHNVNFLKAVMEDSFTMV